MNKIIKNILFPNKIIGFLFFNIGFGLLIFVFASHLEKTPFAYLSYLLSFYALVIFCIWFVKTIKTSKELFKKTKIYFWYKKNFIEITKISLYFSFCFNLVYGLFKLGTGIYYVSWWFITFAIYYLLLCFMKFSLVKNLNNKEKEYKKLKQTGILLLSFNLILIGIIILIIKQNEVFYYDGVLVYLVAMYDFYLMIKAVSSVIKYRKNHGPIIASSKCINLTVAMISMVSLEVVLVTQFGNNDSNFKLVMTSIMGFAICLINSSMSIYMIIRANRNLRKDRQIAI